jgi:peptidoglycan/LPS O-acetylase OafA/YrhL
MMDVLKPKQRFRALDGLRGVCAVLVVLLHIPIKCGILGLAFFNDAYLFVDFFFVLSGFVIAYAYGSLAAGDDSGLARFLIRRFGRLWPLHAAVFGVFVVMSLARLALFNWYGTAAHPPVSGLNLLLGTIEQATLLQAAVTAPPGVMTNGPSWSISTEFWAYILFALVAVGCRKNVVFVRAAIVALSLLLLCRFSKDGIGTVSINWLLFFRCFYGFFLGQIIYGCYKCTASARWQSSWGLGGATAIEVTIVVAVILFVSIVRTSDYSFAAPVLFACAVYGFAPEAGLVSRLLGNQTFQKLGRYSYSIYMIHAVFIGAVVEGLRVVEKLAHVHLIQPPFTNGPGDTGYDIYFGGNWPMLGFAMLILLTVVMTAGWTYRFIEKPGQAFFNRLAADKLAESRIVKPI